MFEREPLIRSGDVIASDGSNIELRTYKSRFWILFIFSLMGCLQCLEWNTWGPISQSVDAAFPGWNSGTVAMMGNWGTIMFVLFIFPMLFLLNSNGLRVGVLTCAFLMAFGTALRCFTLDTPAFTILCHLCAILVGIPGTLIMAAPPLIASAWFPPNERTTATAFCQAMNQLGSAISYLQPLFVRSPGPNVPVQAIREDIQKLMFCTAGVSAALFVSLVAWFPAQPPSPPSLTSTSERFEFTFAIKSLFRKKKFWLLWLSYSVFVGFPAAWMSVLNFSFLTFGIQQDEAMLIGVLAITCSCAAALITGRFTDRFYGHVKKSLLVLILVALFAFGWFLLLTTGVMAPTKWMIYASVILGVSANFAASPLFFELGVETAYPVPEAIVGGVITTGNNMIGILFLLLFFIPSEGYTWVTICLVGSTIFSIFPLLCVREEYIRSAIDRHAPLAGTEPLAEGASAIASEEATLPSWLSRSNSEKLHHV